MKRRTFFQSAAVVAAFALAAPWAAAQLVANRDYAAITPPQPGGVNGQIEVLEFFSYGCPHCNDFDPLLHKWLQTQPADVVFRRVPVSFGRPEWAALGRLYVTLQSMGIADKHDQAVFDGLHKSRLPLWDEKVRNDFLTKQGIDLARFNETWRSFGVDSQMRRAEQLAVNYKVNSVPALMVDGRYAVRGENFDQVLKNASALVAKVRADKKPAAAAASQKPASAEKKAAGK